VVWADAVVRVMGVIVSMEQSVPEQLKQLFGNFSSRSLAALPMLYHDDVVFIDPVHRIEGLVALRRYFASTAEGLTHCEFVYDTQMLAPDSACISWNMHFCHPSLKRGQPQQLRGMTRIGFDSKIYHHEDFYDLGAMIYEHVPIIGGITRLIKRRLGT